MTSGLRSVLGLPPPPTEEEKKEALKKPGPTWKEWLRDEAGKRYFALGLLILDGFLLAVVIQPSSGMWKYAAIPMIPLLGYLDYLAYAFLWAAPAASWKKHQPFHPSPLHPFVMGRFHKDYASWKHGPPTLEGEVAPEEFV